MDRRNAERASHQHGVPEAPQGDFWGDKRFEALGAISQPYWSNVTTALAILCAAMDRHLGRDSGDAAVLEAWQDKIDHDTRVAAAFKNGFDGVPAEDEKIKAATRVRSRASNTLSLMTDTLNRVSPNLLQRRLIAEHLGSWEHSQTVQKMLEILDTAGLTPASSLYQVAILMIVADRIHDHVMSFFQARIARYTDTQPIRFDPEEKAEATKKQVLDTLIAPHGCIYYAGVWSRFEKEIQELVSSLYYTDESIKHATLILRAVIFMKTSEKSSRDNIDEIKLSLLHILTQVGPDDAHVVRSAYVQLLAIVRTKPYLFGDRFKNYLWKHAGTIEAEEVDVIVRQLKRAEAEQKLQIAAVRSQKKASRAEKPPESPAESLAEIKEFVGRYIRKTGLVRYAKGSDGTTVTINFVDNKYAYFTYTVPPEAKNELKNAGRYSNRIKLANAATNIRNGTWIFEE